MDRRLAGTGAARQRTRPRAAPRPGEHNAEVVTGLLGLIPADIAGLAEAGVIC